MLYYLYFNNSNNNNYYYYTILYTRVYTSTCNAVINVYPD